MGFPKMDFFGLIQLGKEVINGVRNIFVRDLPWIPLVAPSVRVFENNRLTGAPKSFVYLNYPWAADLGAP